MKTSLKKVLALVCMLAVVISSSVFMMNASAAEKCDHNWVLQETVQPKCWADGYKLYACSKCPETKKEMIYTDGHKWEDCQLLEEDEMFHVSFCKKCGSYMYEDHDWAGGSCKYCGCEKTNERIYVEGHLPPNIVPGNHYEDEDVGHPDTCKHESFHSVVVEATCEESGYTLNQCDNCAYSYKDNWVQKTGHDWGSYSLYEFDEMFHVGYCSKCGKIKYEKHEWDVAAKGGKCVKCGCEHRADRVYTGRAPYILRDNVGFFMRLLIKIAKVISPNWLYPWLIKFTIV